jgi:NAD(P)-dependent dehydrogenase (short-subunit alcohol dehydrogenase family)
MLTKVLFLELQDTKIRVNSVIPAPTLTDFLATVFSEAEIDGMRQKQILGEVSEFVDQVNSVIEDEKINGEFVLSKRLK